MRFRLPFLRPAVLLLAVLPVAAIHAAPPPPIENAKSALLQGRVDDATTLLRASIAINPHDALAHQLLCRAFYAQDIAGLAVSECEQAVAAAPADSESFMWLGRAYGMKASHASPLAAFSLARKVRASFERSVECGPANFRAIDDLGEFYVAAPAIAGGGLDKAQRLAAEAMPRFPAQAHRLLAEIAEKNKDSATAEAEYKAAVAAAKTPAAYVDLGQFYVTHGRPGPAASAAAAAIAANRTRDFSLVDAASILTAAGKSPQLAEQSLRDYLASPARTDDAPAFKVHIQLAALLAHRGDRAGAHQHTAAALALAANFGPARKSAQGM